MFAAAPKQNHAFLSCVAKIEVKQHPMERITRNISKTIRDIRDPIRAFLRCMVKIPQTTSAQHCYVKMLSSVRYRHVRMLLSVQCRVIHMTYPMRCERWELQSCVIPQFYCPAQFRLNLIVLSSCPCGGGFDVQRILRQVCCPVQSVLLLPTVSV